MNFNEFTAGAFTVINGERHIINKNTSVYTPPEVPDCPFGLESVDNPVMFGHVMFTDICEMTERQPLCQIDEMPVFIVTVYIYR